MQITENMIEAAILKAVEAGLLPRRGTKHDRASNHHIVYAIIDAALQASVCDASSKDVPDSFPMSLPSITHH